MKRTSANYRELRLHSNTNVKRYILLVLVRGTVSGTVNNCALCNKLKRFHSFPDLFLENFRLLMQSFFSPDLSMKISNFSKTVYTISIIFAQSFYTPEVLLRTQWHQNRMTGM